jgi:hypothetical protein
VSQEPAERERHPGEPAVAPSVGEAVDRSESDDEHGVELALPSGPLPWDVYATPIAGRKFARLVNRSDRVAFLPAFFQANSGLYGAVATATCELGESHDAPDARCTCGFYAVDEDEDLWRLGGGDPELVVLDVDLSGRLIEHEHGYRASNQRVRRVRVPRRCARCGREAEMLHRRLFGAVVPACKKCARRPLTLDEASESLEVPVEFSGEEATPATRMQRTLLLLAQLVAPIIVLAAAIALTVPFGTWPLLPLGQLAVVVWLLARPWAVSRLATRLHVPRAEVARLEHRWTGSTVVFTVCCGFAAMLVPVMLLGPQAP